MKSRETEVNSVKRKCIRGTYSAASAAATTTATMATKPIQMAIK